MNITSVALFENYCCIALFKYSERCIIRLTKMIWLILSHQYNSSDKVSRLFAKLKGYNPRREFYKHHEKGTKPKWKYHSPGSVIGSDAAVVSRKDRLNG